MLIVAAMIITAYATDSTQKEPWTTTVVAILVCYALAAMVWFDHATTAVMLAIVTTALLYFKAELRGITTRLERRDLISILQFGVLMFVILPIRPDRDFGPYRAINPHQLWVIVVLISGVSLAGYVAFRLIGQRYGAPLLGIFGGLVSSTATTLVYARHGRDHPELAPTATVVILLANLPIPLRNASATSQSHNGHTYVFANGVLQSMQDTPPSDLRGQGVAPPAASVPSTRSSPAPRGVLVAFVD